jgi:hypothetical protein
MPVDEISEDEKTVSLEILNGLGKTYTQAWLAQKEKRKG